MKRSTSSCVEGAT